MAAKSANTKNPKFTLTVNVLTDKEVLDEIRNDYGNVTPDTFISACRALTAKIESKPWFKKIDSIYPIPKNGVYIAVYMAKFTGLPIVLSPGKNSLVVDDLIDSGKTIQNPEYRNHRKAVLFYKSKLPKGITALGSVGSTWLNFPWEKVNDIEDAVVRELEWIGEDVNREGLLDTPKRVVRSWEKLYGGYDQDPKEILSRTFQPEGNGEYPVILKDIEFYSTCEHHLLPFFGKVTIAYMPSKRIVGVSKLARLVECFARRLQIQERMTEQIADAIDKYLSPKGVYVICEAQHFCMVSRGVEKKNAKMVTRTIRGNSDWLKSYSLGDLS